MVIPFSQQSTRKAVHGGNGTAFGRSEDFGILEFLYPTKTLALLTKLSTYRLDRLAQGRNHIHTRRRFTSSLRHSDDQQEPEPLPHEYISDATSDVPKESKQLINTSNSTLSSPNFSPPEPLHDLRWLLRINPHETEREDLSPKDQLFLKLQNPIPIATNDNFWDSLWITYNALDERDRNFELTRKMMAFMSFSSRENERQRLIPLFKNMLFPEPWQFWKAVLLSSYAGKLNRAMEFHDMALSHGQTLEAGSELILAHAIWKGEWEIAKGVFTKITPLLTKSPKDDFTDSHFSDLWKLTAGLPDLTSLTANLLKESKLQPLDIKDGFIYQIISLAMTYVTNPDSLNRLLPLLRYYGLETSSLYETTIQRILDALQKNPDTFKATTLNILRSLWSSYRLFCEPEEISQSLMHDLLSVLTNPESSNLTWEAEERRLITDILSVYTDQEIPLPYFITVKLMTMYSCQGNVEAVRLLEENLEPKLQDLKDLTRNKNEQEVDLYRLNALLRVHMSRGNSTNVQAEFDAIVAQFPLAKTFRSLWHKIIRSLTRDNNFPQAFRTALIQMPNAGLLPNRHTILHLLRLCGWSADTSAVLVVLNIAEKYNVPLNEWMVRSIIHAHLKSHPGALAEEFERVFATHQINRETWSKEAMATMMNEILIMIANRRDFRSANRIYNRMVEEQLPIKRSTYWALTCLLTNLYQTDQALHLVQNIMPARGIRPNAPFYARLMRGYSIEKRWESILQIRQEIKDRGLAEDVICRQKYLQARAMIARGDPLQDPHILALLKDLLHKDSKTGAWLREESPIWFRYPTDTYFSVLLDAYCDIRAVDMVQAIQEVYWNFSKVHDRSGDPPLGIIRAFMKVALNAGNHDLVAEFWGKSLKILSEYVKEMAHTLSRIPDMVMDGESVGSNELFAADEGGENDNNPSESSSPKSKTDPLLPGESKGPGQDDKENNKPDNPPVSQISVAHLLSKPLMMYISSLSMQEKYQAIIDTVRDIQDSGFILTTKAWNYYVQVLSLSSEPAYILAAFRAAEIHLMPNYIPFIPSIPDKKHRRSMVDRQRRSQASNFQLYLDPGTLRVLKEIHLSAQSATVDGADVGIVTDSNVRLSSAIDSVAPAVTNALKAWEKPNSTKEKLTPKHWRVAQSDKRIRRKLGISSRVDPRMSYTPTISQSQQSLQSHINEQDLIDRFSSPFDDVRGRLMKDPDDQIGFGKDKPSTKNSEFTWRWPDQPLSDDATKLLWKADSLRSLSSTSSSYNRKTITETSESGKSTMIGGLVGLLARTYPSGKGEGEERLIRAGDVLDLLMRDLPPEVKKELPSKLEQAGVTSKKPAIGGSFNRLDGSTSGIGFDRTSTAVDSNHRHHQMNGSSKMAPGKKKVLGIDPDALRSLSELAQSSSIKKR
jgi:pentatricopeptide repeat-containing protein PET309